LPVSVCKKFGNFKLITMPKSRNRKKHKKKLLNYKQSFNTGYSSWMRSILNRYNNLDGK